MFNIFKRKEKTYRTKDEVISTLDVLRVDFEYSFDFRNFAHGYLVGLWHAKEISQEVYLELLDYYHVKR